jgi:hypothetical protein
VNDVLGMIKKANLEELLVVELMHRHDKYGPKETNVSIIKPMFIMNNVLPLPFVQFLNWQPSAFYSDEGVVHVWSYVDTKLPESVKIPQIYQVLREIFEYVHFSGGDKIIGVTLNLSNIFFKQMAFNEIASDNYNIIMPGDTPSRPEYNTDWVKTGWIRPSVSINCLNCGNMLTKNPGQEIAAHYAQFGLEM